MVNHSTEFWSDVGKAIMNRLHQFVVAVGIITDIAASYAAVRWLGLTFDVIAVFHLLLLLALGLTVWVFYGAYDAIATRRDDADKRAGDAHRERDAIKARLDERDQRRAKKDALANLLNEGSVQARHSIKNGPDYNVWIDDWVNRVERHLTAPERAQLRNTVGIPTVVPDIDHLNPWDWTSWNALRRAVQRLGEILGQIPD